MRRIPFEIDRAQRGTLAEQMAEGLRKAIRAGAYRRGDRLPTARELVARFGVSSRIPVAAFKMLAEEGLVDVVPHRGCTVRALRSPVWKGHVLCIVPTGNFSYAVTMRSGRMRSALSEAGYLFTQITVPMSATERPDTGVLDYALQQHVDFAVLMSGDIRLAERLERAGVPFLSHSFAGSDTFRMCRGVYVSDMSAAIRQFVASCRVREVRRALCAVKRPGEGAEMVAAFRKAGVAAEEWCLKPRRRGLERLESLRRSAFDAFDARLAEGRGWLPDVVFFNDDYLATGAMTALCSRGVRFPDDVRIATVANVGNAPVFPGGFDRFDFDQDEGGAMIAEAVLAQMSGSTAHSRLKHQARFVPAEQ